MFLAKLIRFLDWRQRKPDPRVLQIARRRHELSALSAELKSAVARLGPEPDLIETFALASVAAERVLGLSLFDVQLRGALALAQGDIAEMQTGEGKTLAAVPAVTWYALQGRGVHVLTTNDYLARRDAEWMGPVYNTLGLSVGYISQNMPADRRRAAYLCDITYATANEVGFDYLRDGLALDPDELVERPFAFAVIDEADSILIDEARIPLIIAGGVADDPTLARRIDSLVLGLRPRAHYVIGEFARNIQLTDAGIARVESALACGSLFDERNLRILTAVEDALHAHVLLRRDVDYVVKNGAVELVDEFKGRIAENRRWPAGLQSALEAKENVPLKAQGRILGSITMQSLAAMYERICGMTGTAATQADEFWKVYRLPVTVIPPNRPVIRHDLPDILYADRRARDRALVEEIRKVHQTGRPILVGTASVEESERLSHRLQVAAISHTVLNARNDEAEAAIVSQAGALGAVTISTNMAGRGTDILLGGNPPQNRDKVLALGGLYVIGTTRHEARRIDNQLRGRAGRQGDPGASRFFISLDDDLLVRFGVARNPDIESVQRTAESQNLEIRQTLWKYESLVEHHRREVYKLRRGILLSPETVNRRGQLAILDDLWADYLASVAELRAGIHWVSWGGRDPLFSFLTGVRDIYEEFEDRLHRGIADPASVQELFDRGATWTYLTTDQPFGPLGERIVKGLRRRFSAKKSGTA